MSTVPTHAVLFPGNEREPWIRDQYPRLSGDGWWQETVREPLPGFQWLREDGLAVIAGGAVYDGQRWLHVSFSRRDRLPSYDDLKDVKEKFLARHTAIQVFPPASKHVNIHNFCLHLWARADGSTLPDFTRGMGAI